MRHDLADALRAVSRASSIYLEILEDMVRGYVCALRRRRMSRASIQRELSALIAEATCDSSSPLDLYAARWLNQMFDAAEVDRRSELE